MMGGHRSGGGRALDAGIAYSRLITTYTKHWNWSWKGEWWWKREDESGGGFEGESVGFFMVGDGVGV